MTSVRALDAAPVDSALCRPSSARFGFGFRFLGLVTAGAVFLAVATSAMASPPPASFADLAAKVTPAVVNISSKHKAAANRQATPEMPFDFPKGSPFEDFFKNFPNQGQGGTPRPMTALGSGFIIDPDGYVVTNNHVVDGAADITVTLNTGKEYAAKLVGADPKTDLALLKIDAPDSLPAVSFGDSDAIKVGDWVMAVGNPFGLGGTVTAGIVSARSRDIHSGPFDDFLQIDASINQGNSGGPTFAMNGEVVGVNTAIYSPNGGSVGIGFAIPSNLAKSVVAELREHGSIERGWLGVQIQEVTPEIAGAIGMDKPMGALVSEVQPDSPAAKAKLQRGDVIVEFDGTEIERMRDLPRLVAAAEVGDKVSVVVLRDSGRKTLSVEIAKLADDRVAANDNMPAQGDGQTSKDLGLTLSSITPEMRQQFGIPEDVSGVVVVDVDSDGPAAEQGVQPGDVIEQVAQKQVSSPQDVETLTAAAREEKRDAVLLLVNRQGNPLFVAVKFA